MNQFIFALTVTSLFSIQAWSETKKINFYCDTIPSVSSYHFQEKDNEVMDLKITHSSLTAIPVEADFSLNDLARATDAGEAAMNMGKEINLQFSKKQCKIAWGKNRSVRCYNNEPAKIGSVDVDSYYFMYYESLTTLSLSGESDTPLEQLPVVRESHARLAYTINGVSYKMYMPYGEGNCIDGAPPAIIKAPIGEAL